jgi:hypothetical protein
VAGWPTARRKSIGIFEDAVGEQNEKKWHLPLQ